MGFKTLGLCPKPRKLFEKSLTKNFTRPPAKTAGGRSFYTRFTIPTYFYGVGKAPPVAALSRTLDTRPPPHLRWRGAPPTGGAGLRPTHRLSPPPTHPAHLHLVIDPRR